MNRDLTNYRKSYEKYILEEKNVPDSPIILFSDWFMAVEKAGGVDEVNAMTLNTVGDNGFPKSRIVLLKHFDNNGFVFYANYDSENGKAIENNNKVCISFFWPNLERQVIIKGFAEIENENKNVIYFQSLPRKNQLGSWISDQDMLTNSGEIMDKKIEELDFKYKHGAIPKPPFWGGYCIKPIEIEFWQGRPNRLHDRIRYSLSNSNIWITNRLAP